MDADILNELKEIRMLTMLNAKEVLSVRETALLMDRSEGTIRNMAHQHILPYYKPFGKDLYFDKNEILKIMKQGYVPSISDIISRN